MLTLHMNTAIITMNGVEKTVTTFIPELNGELAIVHLSVLKRLSALLPFVHMHNIRERIIDRISCCSNIQEIVDFMKEEIAFQETVNLINTIDKLDILSCEDTVEDTNDPDIA